MATKKKQAAKRLPVRQGDVILIPTDDKPGDTQAPEDPRGLVLAEGETSGHCHALFGRGCKLFNRSAGERMLVIGRGGAELRVVGGGAGGVDRHTPVSLKPGNYLVRVQRSWTSENASRQVQD
jgi:hypothetical protein